LVLLCHHACCILGHDLPRVCHDVLSLLFNLLLCVFGGHEQVLAALSVPAVASIFANQMSEGKGHLKLSQKVRL